MRTEFLRDENNNIWFTYAKDIQIRNLENKNIIAFDPKVAVEK